MTEPSDADYQLVYDEAVRRLEGQERTIDELRVRGGIILATATASSSFLGGFALSGHHQRGLEWVGAALFFAVMVLMGALLYPSSGLRFRLDAKVLIEKWLEGDNVRTGRKLRRDLALRLGEYAACNDQKMAWRWKVFEAAVVLLTLDTVAWLLAFFVH